MKQLLTVVVAAAGFSCTGCIYALGQTTHHISGVLVDAEGEPISGWVGASKREATAEEWGDPEDSQRGLTHTREDGRFSLDHCGPRWCRTLLFYFIPLSTLPDVPILGHIFIHVHEKDGWRTVRVRLTPEQQRRAKPGHRWVEAGRIVVQ